MERNNQQDIHGIKNSRFSPEERARMSRDNEQYREAARNDRPVKKTNKKTVSASNEKSRKAGKASQSNTAGSRNDRVKNSSENRKKQKKRQNNLIIAMLLIVALALLGAFASFSMTVNGIEVSGSERYSDKTVLEAAGLDKGDSMLLVNLGAMEYKIESTLPYIENAVIKRSWPDKIVVTLEDAVASLAIDTGDGYILMNNSCKVLDTDAIVINNSALVKGVSVVEATEGKTVVFSDDVSTENFVKLCSAFAEHGIESISEYDLTSVSNISVILDHRIEVSLGTLAGAPDKLAFCKAVIDETIASDKKHPMIIDVTADGKAYARRKDDNSVSFGEVTTQPSQETTEAETELIAG